MAKKCGKGRVKKSKREGVERSEDVGKERGIPIIRGVQNPLHMNLG